VSQDQNQGVLKNATTTPAKRGSAQTLLDHDGGSEEGLTMVKKQHRRLPSKRLLARVKWPQRNQQDGRSILWL